MCTYLVPIFKGEVDVALVEEIVAVLFIDFEVGDIGSELAVSSFLVLVVEHAEHAWDDAATAPALAAIHGISFPAAGLSVGEDGAVVAFEAALDDGAGYGVEYFLLGGVFAEEPSEGEFLLFLIVGHAYFQVANRP